MTTNDGAHTTYTSPLWWHLNLDSHGQPRAYPPPITDARPNAYSGLRHIAGTWWIVDAYPDTRNAQQVHLYTTRETLRAIPEEIRSTGGHGPVVNAFMDAFVGPAVMAVAALEGWRGVIVHVLADGGVPQE